MNVVNLSFGVPNPIQKRALDLFRAGKRFVLMVSGRQGGKSHFGARWLLMQTMNPNAKNKLAFAVAPTYRMARVLQRKLEEVLKADSRLWARIKHTKQPIPTYAFPNGWTIEVHSSDDPDALRGPTVDAVWYDEVAKGSEESFDILIPTLLASGGAFLGTSTPRGKQNWIYRRLYLKSCEPGHPDHDPDVYNPIYGTVIGSTWENVEHLSEEAVIALEDQYGKGSRWGAQEIQGEFVSYEGLVYRWDEANFLPFNELPERKQYSFVMGGIDFGWTDPEAIVVMGYKDGVWYVLDEHYESGMSINEAAMVIADLHKRHNVELWFADSARPERIDDLVSRGIPVRPVEKPQIEDRIREMAMFTDSGRFKVSWSAPYVRDELQSYQYPEEDRLLRDKRRNPLDRNNHAMDACGYVIWSMRYVWRNDANYKVIVEDGDKPDPEDEKTTLYGRPIFKKSNKRYGPSGIVGR